MSLLISGKKGFTETGQYWNENVEAEMWLRDGSS